MDGFEVASGGIRAVSKDESTPALAADVEAVGFGGAVLSLSARRSSASESFRLLQGTVARVESGKEGEDGNGGTIRQGIVSCRRCHFTVNAKSTSRGRFYSWCHGWRFR